MGSSGETPAYLTFFLVSLSVMFHTTEGPLSMQVHGAMIGAAAYGVMLYGLKQPSYVALKHSVLIANLTAAYMVMYGHALPF